MDIKLESKNDSFLFRNSTRNDTKTTTRNTSVRTNGNAGHTSVNRSLGITRSRPAVGVTGKRQQMIPHGPLTLTSQQNNISQNGECELQIVCQPEQQHRARYQTEGSRGAVKDRTGNGFPIVRLLGYNKPTTLQVFIGTDFGRVAPHMFYQACKVSGKNSTPCIERRIDGTIMIEIELEPAKDMMVTCDCVGILKERNVDVEHRFPQEAGVLQGRSKKKSTRCRMVFRTTIINSNGASETLQICSQPIVCTQPPGVPEISKKSLTSCPCSGGLELFILGKNFLKDTRVVFQLDPQHLSNTHDMNWECTVLPDKEFLQQTHLVCIVPPYKRQDLSESEAIRVKLFIISSGKTSEAHDFIYTSQSSAPEPSIGSSKSTSYMTVIQDASTKQKSISNEELKSEANSSIGVDSNTVSVMMWNSSTSCSNSTPEVMMPPPNLVANPMMGRRSSSCIQLIIPDNLKTEIIDENSQNSLLSDNGMANLTSSNHSVIEMTNPLDQLVNENSKDSSQSQLIKPSVANTNSPVQDLLDVVDIMRNPHQMPMVTEQSPFNALCDSSKEVGVVDLCMKNQADLNGISNNNNNYTSASINQNIATQNVNRVENFLNQIDNSSKKAAIQDPHFIQNAIIDDDQNTNLLSTIPANVRTLKELVNSKSDGQQTILSPIRGSNNSNTLAQNSPNIDQKINKNPEGTENSTSISSESMLLETLLPTQATTSLLDSRNSLSTRASNIRQESSQQEVIITAINSSLISGITKSAIVATTNSSVNVNSVVNAPHNSIQTTDVINSNMQQIQALTQQEVVMQQQVHQVEQVVAQVQQVQQQVEQVVAHAHQQAVQAVQQAQQQVVQQVVQHAQVVQQAVQKVQAVQQAPAAPAVQQAVQQATQEVVQQAVQQATQEVVQQVQAVQQAVQHAQAAQAMQQAVQQDIGSVLSQPVGFVAEASSALASGAAQEPSQQQLTTAAEQAINSVITNATHDIINNRPIRTTTAHAIIATKNILNSVATQSAQLMNNAMENILPKSPSNSNITEQATNKPQSVVNLPINVGKNVQQTISSNNQLLNEQVAAKQETNNGILSQEITSMSDQDLLSYIDVSCFDPQHGFIM